MTAINERRRWIRRAAVLVVALAALGFFVEWFAGRMIERRLHQRLAEAGWTLERGSALWGPFDWLVLTNIKLRRGSDSPALEVERVAADFQLWGGDGGSRWEVKSGELVLRDSHGEIRLQDVQLDLEVRPGEVGVTTADARYKSLVVSTKGKILWSPTKGSSGYEPDFSAVRGTLGVLDFTSREFHMTGSFSVDGRQRPPQWSADLHGEGTDTTWHGVPLKGVRAAAAMSSGQSTITVDLVLPSGESRFTVTKADWSPSPYRIDGTVTDDAGQSDRFSGRYQTGKKQWILDSLSGPANLWQLAKEIPPVASKMPGELYCNTFPAIDVEDASWTRDEGFRVKSVTTSGNGSFKFDDGNRQVYIDKIRGGFAYDDSTWTLKKLSAEIFDGQVTVSGKYQAPMLTGGKVSLEAMSLAKLKEWAGEEATGKGLLFASYSGNVNTREKELTGKGKVRLENAPVIEVPLLDQVAELFTAMIPGSKRPGSGEFHADFIADSEIVEVPEFRATGGTLTVTAKGTVNLKQQRVDGSARGKLDGLPGLVTRPLSRLLEMEVSGPYDDIRVKPLGPPKLVSNAASATVGVAVETIEEAGKVSGTVIVESIKVPFRWLQKKREDSAR